MLFLLLLEFTHHCFVLVVHRSNPHLVSLEKFVLLHERVLAILHVVEVLGKNGLGLTRLQEQGLVVCVRARNLVCDDHRFAYGLGRVLLFEVARHHHVLPRQIAAAGAALDVVGVGQDALEPQIRG